jgi:AraC-like DNA-binding protein
VELHLSLLPDEILAIPALHDYIQAQSASFLGMFEQDPRLSAVFATQQRWLMSHIGLSLFFRTRHGHGMGGLYLSTFLDEVQTHQVASRNTADSFIKELAHYNYITLLTDVSDRRLRPMALSANVVHLFGGWVQAHLASLDGLAGGNRLATFQENPSIVADLQPRIADGLLAAKAIRNPEKTFSLFTWLDNGGVVMDWLITNMERAPLEQERVRVGAFSVGEMATRLSLSRTHLARKLREAETMGSIGWEGRRGHSGLWVSSGFRHEYARAQAVKLSIIDHAWDAVMAPEVEPRKRQHA